MVNFNNIYTSTGCNSTPGAADWGKNGLVIFGACNSVALLQPNYDSGSSKILRTFVGHHKRVICVKWINPQSDESYGKQDEYEFISGADDGLCIYWDMKLTTPQQKIVLSGHTSGITAVDGIYNGPDLTIVTTSTDSTVKIWRNHELSQTISLKTGFSFSIRIIQLPQNDQNLLVFSTDDSKIKLYAEAEDHSYIYSNELVGHEDWVRGIDAIQISPTELLIASSSQDTFIRLFKINVRDENKEIVKLGKTFKEHEELEIEEILFTVGTKMFSITLESVLQSHEGWVYGVHLIKNADTGEVLLLSSSIDKTLIIWSCEKNEEMNEIWNEKIRVGDMGGNSLGFYGGKFSPDGKSILGHSYHGSFHLWNLVNTATNLWQPSVISGGHYKDVNDLCWEPNGEFLLSASTDQTTRCHSYWTRPDKKLKETWHEIARPQIHGYDIQCITCLSRYRFASGADEKIIRTFQAPMNFVENFIRLSSIPAVDEEGAAILSSSQKGASVPSLGLSNRAVSNDNGQDGGGDVESHFTPLNLENPPFEENLMQNTLWPEIQKLYGHGNEIYAIGSSQNGKYLASACRASTAEHAQIIIWNPKTWKQIQKLSGNTLTISQLKFSPNNKYLLSVSRDRRWCLFENHNGDDGQTEANFQLIQQSPAKGAHSRIIWSCDWSHDSNLFLTGSRDGKVMLWQLCHNGNHTQVEYLDKIELANNCATAVAFYQKNLNNQSGTYLVAVGTESGEIILYTIIDKHFQKWDSINDNFSHHLTVTKLQFRPVGNTIQLASCGKDHFVRINEVMLNLDFHQMN